MGVTLADGGVNPVTGERIVDEETCRARTAMTTLRDDEIQTIETGREQFEPTADADGDDTDTTDGDDTDADDTDADDTDGDDADGTDATDADADDTDAA